MTKKIKCKTSKKKSSSFFLILNMSNRNFSHKTTDQSQITHFCPRKATLLLCALCGWFTLHRQKKQQQFSLIKDTYFVL